MATGDQVKALIRSHADGDDTRFYAIAMQVAAQVAQATVRRWRDDGIGVAREASCVLAELRALLLPKLLCGGLRIRDTEHAVEGVA